MIDNRFYELIAHTWRGGRFGYLWTNDDGEGAKYTYWRPVDWRGDLPKLFKDKDTYFGVHPSVMRRSDAERARIDDISNINCLFAEIDCKTPEEKKAKLEWLARWHIKPACVVDSGGGFHIYVWLKDAWVLDAPEKRQRAADLQWAFAQLVNGDTSVNDLARVLRVPGTTNWKAKYSPNFPTVEIVHWKPSAQYDLNELEPHLQPILDQRNATKAHTPPANSGAVDHVADRELLDILFGSKNGVMYQALWGGDLSTAGGDHSKADQMLCNGLAWLTSRDALRIDHLFRQSGLMRDKWDRDAYRNSTINNAINSTQTVYDPGYRSAGDDDAVAAAQAAVGSVPPSNGGNGASGGGTPPSGNGGSGGGSQPSPKKPKGLTSAQQAAIDLLFAESEWDLLGALCTQIPVKHGRSYLRAKFLTMHNGDNNLADEEIKRYRFLGMPVSEQIEADLTKWGYSFSETELDGTIFCNGQPVDEAIRAQISLNGRDNGYGGKQLPLAALSEVMLVMARRNRYHPVRDWLKSLAWDGQSRLTELINYVKDKHPPIVYPDGSTISVFGAFLRRWMLGAIERAFGNKDAQNPVLVLAGAQGMGKSYLPKWLCSEIPDHFIEGPVNPESLDDRRLLVTRFIWEISELPGTMNKADADALKSFLTTGEATFRVPYAKDPITKPALASFFGTLNPTVGHLVDVTGNRRFFSIELDSIDRDYSQAISVSQLWAEMMYHYYQGMSYKLQPIEEQTQAQLNDAARATTDTTEALHKYYDIDPSQTNWFEFTVDIVEVLRDKGYKTGVKQVGTELRGMLGYASVERRVLNRKGTGFYGIQRK